MIVFIIKIYFNMNIQTIFEYLKKVIKSLYVSTL